MMLFTFTVTLAVRDSATITCGNLHRITTRRGYGSGGDCQGRRRASASASGEGTSDSGRRTRTMHARVEHAEKLFTACKRDRIGDVGPAFPTGLVGCKVKSFTESVIFVDRATPSPLPVIAMVALATGVLPAVVCRVTTD